MTAQVKTVTKTAEIDGKPINWSVLTITGYIGGDFQTLELKLSKTEKMLADILLANTEEQPTQNSRPANAEEQETFLKEQKNTTSIDIFEE